MTSSQKRRSWRRIAGRAFLLVALYALSIGPFLWLYARGHLDSAPPWLINCIDPFYAPLLWFVEGVPGVSGIFHSYMDLWRA